VDPWLKSLSFWDEETPVLVWSCYAVHPMSYYGKGQVSADFPGLARSRRQADNPAVFQIYFTGCAGDTTAGKYNTGAHTNRAVLADRLCSAMLEAWQTTRRQPLKQVDFRAADLKLPARSTGQFGIEAMQATLANTNATRWRRIEAALGLSWRQRVDRGQGISVPCLDIGKGAALFTILPAECFVGYQLAAQKLRPGSFVMVAGFGDGAPGYVPTDKCWLDGYEDDYCWVPPMTETVILRAVEEAVGGPPAARAGSR
jgi:hypothetical protein